MAREGEYVLGSFGSLNFARLLSLGLDVRDGV